MMKTFVGVDLRGRNLDPSAISFFLFEEPRRAYSRNTLLPDGNVPEAGRWECGMFVESDSEIGAILSRLCDKIAESIHRLRTRAHVDTITFMIRVPDDISVSRVQISSNIIARIALIDADMLIDIGCRFDADDEHWKL